MGELPLDLSRLWNLYKKPSCLGFPNHSKFPAYQVVVTVCFPLGLRILEGTTL